MKLLVFGQTGQVARELARALGRGSWPIQDARFVGRAEADLTHPADCAQIIADSRVDAVINAAAYTAVDTAESDEHTAALVNGAAPAAMAQAAAAKAVPLLHISTDYVFDGTGTAPFRPADPTAPLGAYGRTKLAGEHGVLAAGSQNAVLRTSWVFSAHGRNFVKTMLRLGAERDTLDVVADQIGGPTPAAAIAETLLTMASSINDGQPGGLYHFAGAPEASWAGFARAIMTIAGLDCAIRDIDTVSFPTPATRPANSRLDCSDLARDFGIGQPDWRSHLQGIIEELRHDAA